MEEKQNGVVKWFSKEKGFGFITPENSKKDVFVHFSNILGNGFKELLDGEKVTFSVQDSEKGSKAIEVQRL